MANIKIAFIGAGSMCFAPRLLKDFAGAKAMHGARLALMDIDPKKKDLITNWAKDFYKHHGIDYKVTGTTRLETAVKDADFVIVSVSSDRVGTWEKDLRIPKKYGVHQYLSENGGPGGLAHGLRSCTIVHKICLAIEKHAPRAFVLDLTNPMMRVCTVMRDHTNLRCVGLCHQAYNMTRKLADEVLGLPFENVNATIAGVNHFTWALHLRENGTGRDLYPLLKRKLKKLPPDYEPLTRDLYKYFGLWALTGDDHVHEYVPYVHTQAYRKKNKYRLAPFPFARYKKNAKKLWLHHQRQAEGKTPIEPLAGGHSGEYADRIITAIIRDENSQILSLNIPNKGHIDNLPEDAIVEVPCVVNATGIHGVHVGALPRGIASMCNRQIDINELTAQAAVEGDRKKALQALILDPYIDDMDAAEKTLDAYLKAHKKWLPQFKARHTR